MIGADNSRQLTAVLVRLLKGVLYRDEDPTSWQALGDLESHVRDHVAVLGLELVVDPAEGFAYLRQLVTEDAGEVPRLVPRRRLSYPVSLLLVLLRRKLAEFDASSGDTRLVLSRDQVAESIRVFLSDTGNEARFLDRLDSDLNKVADLGFIRRLRGKDDQFEVRRLLKAFVDAQWLSEFDQRLAEYRAHAESAEAGEGGREGE